MKPSEALNLLWYLWRHNNWMLAATLDLMPSWDQGKIIVLLSFDVQV